MSHIGYILLRSKRSFIGGQDLRPRIVRWMFLLTSFAASVCYGQFGVSSHTVTVQVSQLSYLQVNGGAVNLNITSANSTAGQDQMTLTEQSTSLQWGTNKGTQKVTAVSNLVTPNYTLKLVALSPTVGTAAAEFTLNSTANDLLLDIGRSAGSCTLKYTGIALASQGTGSDAHTITFTIQTQ